MTTRRNGLISDDSIATTFTSLLSGSERSLSPIEQVNQAQDSTCWHGTAIISRIMEFKSISTFSEAAVSSSQKKKPANYSGEFKLILQISFHYFSVFSTVQIIFQIIIYSLLKKVMLIKFHWNLKVKEFNKLLLFRHSWPNQSRLFWSIFSKDILNFCEYLFF